MKTQQTHALIACLATMLACTGIAACDSIRDNPNFEVLACSAVDCNDPDTLEAVQAVQLHGGSKAQLTCNGIAFGSGTRFSRFSYQAALFADGGCFAVTAINETTGQANGSGFIMPDETGPGGGHCTAPVFFPALVRAQVDIRGPNVHVESPACTTALGTGCDFPLSSCTVVGVPGAFNF